VADHGRAVVMCKAANREEERCLIVEDMEKFPCTDLRTIDRLWVKYSNGRFGFSVQKRIWESVGVTPQVDYETFCRFVDKVGWRVEEKWVYLSKVTFNKNAPLGHLPFSLLRDLDTVRWKVIVIRGRGLIGGLFSRIETCRV